MNPNVPMFLSARARARAAGDRGLERAIQADLDRLGYSEPMVRVERVDGMETTAVRTHQQTVPKRNPRGAKRSK